MVDIKIISVIAILCLMCNYSVCDDVQESPLHCPDLKPQNNVSIDQVLGYWYGNQIIMHHDSIHSELALDTCDLLYINDITRDIPSSRPRLSDQLQEYHYLKLIWSEQDTILEYIVRFNKTRPGFWFSSTRRSGPMLKSKSSEYPGFIQILKVTSDYAVLTFCERVPNKQFLTIVLSRQPNTLSAEDFESVQALLRQRGLQTVSVRNICGFNGSGLTTIHSISSHFITACIAYVLKYL